MNADGETLPLSHVLEVGQIIYVKGLSCVDRVPETAPVTSDVVRTLRPTQIDPIVSPTMTWSQQIETPALMKPSIFDIGECTTSPADPQPGWLCAEPLLGLQGDQFLMLSATAC